MRTNEGARRPDPSPQSNQVCLGFARPAVCDWSNVFLLFHAIEQIDAHRKGEIDGASVLIFIPGKCLDAGGCARTVADETIKSRPARNQEKTDESSRPL